MAKTTRASDETAATTPSGLRRCIGSTRFGIEPHEAAVEDFPRQPSQKDGLGRMCKAHWNQYTAGLARDAQARKAAEAGEPVTDETLLTFDETIAEAEPEAARAPKRDSGPAPAASARTSAAGKRRRIASTEQGNR